MKWYAERKIITGRWCPTLFDERPTEVSVSGEKRQLRCIKRILPDHAHLSPAEAETIYGSKVEAA